MKHKKQYKRAMSFKAHVRGGHFYLHLSLPTRWLVILVAVVGAFLTSTPVAQVMEMLSRLLR